MIEISGEDIVGTLLAMFITECFAEMDTDD